MREKWRIWWLNASTAHHRWMMRYLQRRGWVVFYLDERARFCRSICWLHEYKNHADYILGQ